MKSTTSIKQSEVKEKWFVIDATGQRIGTLASKAAELLQGKHNPLKRDYHTPNTKVVIIHAGKIDFTFKRGMTKFYKNYSGFPGGLKFTSLADLFAKHPERPLEIAIRGMLPKTKAGDAMFSNLKVYAEGEHKHEAQKPEVVNVRELKL